MWFFTMKKLSARISKLSYLAAYFFSAVLFVSANSALDVYKRQALDRYDEGDYFLDGQDMNQCSDKELAKIRNDSIGLVMQDFALLGDKKVIFNVMLPMFFDHTPFKRCV